MSNCCSNEIMISILVQPMMYIPNQLIGAPVNTQVTMECTTEASPKVGSRGCEAFGPKTSASDDPLYLVT